jgi:serine/threonine-protein kinase
MSCAQCRATVPAGSRFCPHCGSATDAGSVLTMTSGHDVTTIATPTPAATRALHSSWATGSGSVDHGRFEPGLVLDGRYRVLGLLGRGGMGEVYRADDLRLGQQVALKFLPASLSSDPARLAQFHNEVRTARQVSHPNVCRVYDIGEIDGQLFITMEYVDGEDLSVLLRRIGRLPEDKGIDIARQICAGLAAAHERGVLHRDLKPANIMLDGSGRARIMDFSLAAVGDVADIRAGTPAYMAPEQLAGQEVTVRSDVYALGLVLYEIFTGRRAFDATNLSDLLEQHRAGTIASPTTVVKSLDPAIESAILRCLDPIAVRRPSSAIAVSAALPGGDPLAAALAAGETPSPEMVAAAGGEGAALSLPAGVLWLTIAAIGVIAAAILAGRSSLLSRVPLHRPGAVLADRAEEIRTSFGYADTPVDRSFDFGVDQGYLTWAATHGRAAAGWTELARGRPSAVQYWYRTSPVPLVPLNPLGTVGPNDPPVVINGMTRTWVDSSARLLYFEAAPPQIEREPVGTPAPFDWQTAFTAAGLSLPAFTETTPARTPAGYADERKAWKGTLPDTDIPITIEAAAYRGRPILFQIVLPWTASAREPRRGGSGSNWIFISFLLVGAAVTAYLNLRRGRADRRGAFRLAAFMFLTLLSAWIIGPHVNDGAAEQQRFFARAGIALFVGGAMYLLYLGLEPFVRRLWPEMLVGWTRVLSGRLRDPLIGRDALVGVAGGAALALLALVPFFAAGWTGRPMPTPNQTDLSPLWGLRGTLIAFLQSINNGLQNTLINVFVWSFLRIIFEWVTRTPVGRSRWTIASKLRMSERVSDHVFVACSVLIGAFTAYNAGAPDRWLVAAQAGVNSLLLLLVLLRIGLFALAMMLTTASLLQRMPMTFDSDALYVSATWAALAVLGVIAVTGFRLATRPGRSAMAAARI